jgi:tetratricopeptide (TPR) repeat protein
MQRLQRRTLSSAALALPGLALAGLALAGLALAGLALAGAAHRHTEVREHVAAAARRTADEARVLDADLAFYAIRAARDPSGATDLAQLAGLYLQRARASGDNADLVRAETTARRSLAHRTAWNGRARLVLASSLVGQHRYTEALDEARRLAADEPDRVSFRALRAEIEMEVGRYDAADADFRALQARAADPSVGPRLARWAELRGDLDRAHRLLVAARDAALARPNVPAEQLAWYHLRVGDFALRNGRLAEAARAFADGLAVSPDDHRLLAARARLEAARHEWRAAIADGERALAIALDPATLGLIGDAYGALGDRPAQAQAYRAMDVSISAQTGLYHRAWSLFLLDHGRRVPAVLARVERDARERTDVYGEDLLAWARYTAGDPAGARRAMDRALALGTRDAMLHYHAGMIARALGDRRSAAWHLATALRLNPHWHPTQPASAAAVLDTLARDSPPARRP